MSNGSRILDSDLAGRWLRSRSNSELGLGFCTLHHNQFQLTYVDIPDVAEHRVSVPKSDLIDAHIPKGTRVWLRGKQYGWVAGVVESTPSGGRYDISLENASRKRSKLVLHEDQFKVRWAKPLQDPALAVAHGMCEGPHHYLARSALRSQLIEQRRVCRGLTAAVSAPIKLFQHQIDTAARVLTDPVMRYALADAVGLGKTIEAGIVVRQIILDDPNARVLILVPANLCGQWIAELKNRLGLAEAFEASQLTVGPHNSLRAHAGYWPDGLCHYDLVVIDEVHRLLEQITVGSSLERELTRVDGLLALSATPMHGDIAMLQRLMRLVDPVAYGTTTETDFRARLDERERNASAVRVLTARRASLRIKSQVLDELTTEFPEDETIQKLADECRDSGDSHHPCWSDLAVYVREVYRLSRRMIRHRRTPELTDSYAVAGRRPTFVDVEDPSRGVIDGFLESYRLRCMESSATADYADAVECGLAGPIALRGWLRSRPPGKDSSLFEMTVARLERVGLEARLQVAVDVVVLRLKQQCRIVVVSSFAGVLARFDALLSGQVDGFRVHRHYASMTLGAQDSAVDLFRTSRQGAVLLADTSIEEGRNLQFASVLVNLDVPLNPNRLDQRIGRLDRYAVRSDPAEVVVLTEVSSEWVTAHIQLMKDSIGVFDESVSTVQRLLGKITDEITSRLLESGSDALKFEVDELRAKLEVEQDEIDRLEELESVDAAAVFDNEAFEELREYEESAASLRNAMRRFTSGSGSLGLRLDEAGDGIVSFGLRPGIGLPRDEIRALERLFKPKAFAREASLSNLGVSPLRIGDPLVDWLNGFMDADERGRTSAVVRATRGISTPYLCLHCDFLVEFNAGLGPGQQDEGDHGRARRLSRRGEAHLQPLLIETWTDAVGPVSAEVVEEVLSMPFDLGRDEVVSGRLWEPVLMRLPNWRQECLECAEVARSSVVESTAFSSSVQRALGSAERDATRRLEVLRARSHRLPTGSERLAAQNELRMERDMADAVDAGIRNPLVRLIACGAWVLWPADEF